MAIDLTKFKQFCDQLTQVDFFGEGLFRPPWKYPPTSEVVVQAIEAGTADLPPAYRSGYVTPLIANMQHLLLQTGGKLEPYAGVIYQYAEGSPVAEPLHRFLAKVKKCQEPKKFFSCSNVLIRFPDTFPPPGGSHPRPSIACSEQRSRER
jgi:hypothetical protein